MKISHEMVGFGQLAAVMDDLAKNLDDKLTPAARASAEKLRSKIQSEAPRQTGRLASSFKIATKKGEATVYSDVPYAHRVEYGFMDTDELGRTYHVPPDAFVQRAGAGLVDDFLERITKVFD